MTKCIIGKPSWQCKVRMLILQVRHSEAYLTSAWAYLASVRFEVYSASTIWNAYLASVRFEGIFGKHHLGSIFGKCEIWRYIWQAPLEVLGNPAVLLEPSTAVVFLLLLVFLFAKHGMCLVLLLELRRKSIWQMYVLDAYVASTRLWCLWQSLDRDAWLASTSFGSLFSMMMIGKPIWQCIVGKPMLDAAAAPKAQKDTKNTQQSSPKYQFWKWKCFKIASWSRILFPNRF